MLTELSVKDFIRNLSLDTPTPGGGSAAALTGSMSAALIEMVLQVSLKKKDDPGEVEKCKEIAKKCSRLSKKLILLVDEDAGAFDKVIAAYKMPRKNEEEKEHRRKEIQLGLKAASLVPLEVMRNVKEVFDYFDFVINTTVDSAISDVGVALLLADTATRGAFYNVVINLKFLKDGNFKKEIEDEATKIILFVKSKLDVFEEKIQRRLNPKV